MTISPDLARLLNEGLSNAAIARQLRVATKTVRAAREQLGLPPSQHGYPHGLTLEETWAARTQPVDGGHLVWTGARNSDGVPGVTYRSVWHSARAIAFRMRTGRDPDGYTKTTCHVPGCVAPACVDDTAIRQRDREALRAVLGMPARPETCGRGHDQAVHGRLDGRNVHYCAVCNATASTGRRTAA